MGKGNRAAGAKAVAVQVPAVLLEDAAALAAADAAAGLAPEIVEYRRRLKGRTPNAAVEAAYLKLHAGVQAIVTGEDWKKALAFTAKFHKYSFSNRMLIKMQCPQATYVASFNLWRNSLGRHVTKGEKAIHILAPITVDSKTIDPATGKPERVMIGTRPVPVFDISQTEGEPLDLPTVTHQLQGGGAPEVELYDRIASRITALGFSIHRDQDERLGHANGMTGLMTREVVVRSTLSLAQSAKTLTHEYAHIILDHKGGSNVLQEAEAESTAYFVLSGCGIDSSDYSFGYVAEWSQGDTLVVERAGQRALDAATSILKDIATPAADAASEPEPEDAAGLNLATQEA